MAFERAHGEKGSAGQEGYDNDMGEGTNVVVVRERGHWNDGESASALIVLISRCGSSLPFVCGKDDIIL